VSGLPLLQAEPASIASEADSLRVLTVSFLVFLTQPGFALLAARRARAKNAADVTTTTPTDRSMGVLALSLTGASVAAIAGRLTSPGWLSTSAARSDSSPPPERNRRPGSTGRSGWCSR